MSAACTMADVAKLVGCSTATVSMALRHDLRIPEATRKRVEAAAKKLNYRADPMLSALVARRNSGRKRQGIANLAVLVDDRWDKSAHAGWLGKMIKGMELSSERLGYHLTRFNLWKDLDAHRDVDRVLCARGIRGIVLTPTVNDDFPFNIDSSLYAMVVIGNSRLGQDRHRVGSDAYAGMQLTLENLSRRGYKRIGYAQPLQAEKRLRYEWLGAFAKEHYLQQSSLKIIPPYLPRNEVEQGHFIKWLKRHEPDCLIISDNEFATLAKDAGYRIPEDLGIVFLAWESATHPNPTGIAQHLDISGRSAIEQLHTSLLYGEIGLPSYPKVIRILPHWESGATIRSHECKVR